MNPANPTFPHPSRPGWAGSSAKRSWFLVALATAPIGFTTTARAVTLSQSDWSGGTGNPGPALRWESAFARESGVAWRSLPGQLALAGNLRGQPIREVVAEDADLPRGAATGDLKGDGRTDLVIGDPVTNPFEPVGAIYWWRALEEEGQLVPDGKMSDDWCSVGVGRGEGIRQHQLRGHQARGAAVHGRTGIWLYRILY